jgi:hypothetical protein
MTGQRTFETDHGTTGHKVTIGPAHIDGDRIAEMRANQSAKRSAEMSARYAAVEAAKSTRRNRKAARDAKYAPESGDVAGVEFLLYAAVLTD